MLRWRSPATSLGIRLGLERLVAEPPIQRIGARIVQRIHAQVKLSVPRRRGNPLDSAHERGPISLSTARFRYAQVYDLWQMALVVGIRLGARAAKDQDGERDDLIVEHQNEVAQITVAGITKSIAVERRPSFPFDRDEGWHVGFRGIAHGDPIHAQTSHKMIRPRCRERRYIGGPTPARRKRARGSISAAGAYRSRASTSTASSWWEKTSGR